MIQDVIERFRYRFELWRRERQEDLLGLPRNDPRSLRQYRAERSARHRWFKQDDPKYQVILIESTPRFVIRIVGVYFAIIFIAAQLFRLIGGFIPGVRFGVGISLVVFIGLWTLLSISTTIDFCRRRKAQREATTSSNKSLQPTAGRSDD
jgi:hypothetical protein